MHKKVTANAPKADPQTEIDTRGIGLDFVGINNVKYPVTISGWDNSGREEIKDACLSLQVSLASEVRGIHMSRLLESLHHWGRPLNLVSIPEFLRLIRQQQNSYSASVDCNFIWFMERPSPMTGLAAWQGVETTWHGLQNDKEGAIGYTLNIPITTLCPCSREISDYGAHSQRGWIRVKLEWGEEDKTVSPVDIFSLLQHAGSAPIYPLLKRTDERHVTMLAYDQPAFVEDTLRQAAVSLRNEPSIKKFDLHICNEESIHTHNAIASLRFTR